MSEKSEKSEHPSWYIPILEVFDDFSKCFEGENHFHTRKPHFLFFCFPANNYFFLILQRK